MTCDKCQHAALSLFTKEGQNEWLCRDCYQHPPSRIQANAKHYWPDGSGSITAAHLDDIEHRLIMDDGQIKRNVGRKYI